MSLYLQICFWYIVRMKVIQIKRVQPFMPGSSILMFRHCGLEESDWDQVGSSSPGSVGYISYPTFSRSPSS